MNTAEEFLNLTAKLRDENKAYVLAELNDLLTAASGDRIESLAAPDIGSPYLANYVAAMVELAAHIRGVDPPLWTSAIPPLAEPVLPCPGRASERILTLASPVPFRRRNIFIDSSIGARV